LNAVHATFGIIFLIRPEAVFRPLSC